MPVYARSMRALFRPNLISPKIIYLLLNATIVSPPQLPLNNRYIITRLNHNKTHPLIMSAPISEHIYTNDTPVIQLNAKTAFDLLTQRERLYAHHLSKASFYGSLIVLFQTSPESPLIFTLFRLLFSAQSIDQLKDIAFKDAQFNHDDWTALLVYNSAFLSNMGNYRGFGDSKFIPSLSKEKFETLLHKSVAFRDNQSLMTFLWDNVKERIYSLTNDELSLGFYPKGVTTYFSKGITEEDSKLVKQFMEKYKIDAYNSRVFKNGPKYEIRFASILNTNDSEANDYLKVGTDDTGFTLTRGDYSPILKLVNHHLCEAQKYVSNDHEKEMIKHYILHFKTGSLEQHKDGSREWIKDKGPIIETYIGFIETYRDPSGMRGEFEGFVAVVNKEMSEKFSSLVNSASSFLPLLPWPKEYEKDKFLKPDFTSLDVLTFSGSGIPAGINIPNYDEIRQNEGFKNVALNNVISASLTDSKPNFLSSDDAKLMEKYLIQSFEVQVGLHELLGHGSGKLFRIDDNGQPNFDKENTINPLTNKKVDQWYNIGESWDSKFGALSSAFEECRAEVVGLYLCLEPNVLEIFGLSGIDADEVIYTNWLSMVHKGIESLKMYQSANGRWLQAHSQARYVITRVMLESDPKLLNIDYIEKSPNDGTPDLLITMTKDLNLIKTVGKKIIGDFLLKLQVYKSMGDIQNAQEMFDKYSTVDDTLEYPYLKFRDVVLARKKPRKIFVEASTSLGPNDTVELKSYDSTHYGVIQSFLDHINEPNINQVIVDLWKNDAKYFV